MPSTRRDFLKRTLAAAAATPLFGSSRAVAAPPARPNIVLVFIDDMGYGDVGPYGSTKNRTPNLDRMAAEGMKLTSFYAAPVCSVSRAQVMTGCYGPRVSIPGVFFPGGEYGINAEEHTVAELLKAQGYATMCIGKWHLGDQPEFLPTRHGFDHYLGLPYSNDMMKKAQVNGQNVVPLVRDEQVSELLTGDGQDRLTEIYTNEAVRFITDNKDRPFFLYLPHTAVHVPVHPGEQFRGKSANGRYGDWVEEVDWSVGRVLAKLRELNLAEKTLVIFTSDNGPWLTQGANGGSAGPLRGGKGSTWEGGVREPTIAWWPGQVKPGTACDAAAGNIDFLPTFVSLAGGQVPTDRKIDGADFSPLLFGASTASQRQAHYYYNGYRLQAVRVGPWKLAVAPQNDGKEQVAASLEQPRLYNLDKDLGERTDVAADQAEVVTRLRALAVAMAAELGDGKPGPAVRPAGHVDHPRTLYPLDEGTAAGTTAVIEGLKVGDTLRGEQAPLVKGRALTIACEVATTANDGVIVAHGGMTTGYALYLRNGCAVFAVHQSGNDVVRITSPSAIGAKATLEARLAADGTMTLSVDGRKVATGRVSGALTNQPAEAFCVGFDEQKPVDDYDGQKRFAGIIRNLKVGTEATR
ncbi:MAG: sulfatase-like hydrolase/transferase [Armatimonadetes bacterium]|nr:sulfatase-like hydrolase/transferase [Armatimonadota bacterium]